ncbi:MAG: CdaR family protein [Acidobacteriota bacterium]|nr:CdaR family protein [Acidobacteriota bacterium]
MNFELPKSIVIEKEQRRAFLGYWFSRIFLDDWLMKVVALVITLALWLGVTGLQTAITRPINNVSLNTLVAKDLEITNALIPEVDIEISGDKRQVDQVNEHDIAVTLDLTDLREGDRTIQLTPQGISVKLPSGVAVTKISPERIAVKLERVEETQVAVRIETNGAPATGFEVYSKAAVPSRVGVRGPKSHIESLSYVTTDKIDLTGRRAGFVSQQVPLNVSDPKISLKNTVTATVTLQIGRVRVERLMVVPYETDTRSGRASVRLYGPEATLEDLTPEDLLIVEAAGADGKPKLELVLPAGVKGEVVVRSIKFRE